MAKSISNMFVSVGGSIAPLAASFADGAREVGGFLGKLEKAAAGVANFSSKIPKLSGLIGGLGVAFSAASAVGMVKGQLESVDALAKLSDRTGIATEQLVGLQHAADLAGISSEELTGGVEKLLKNLDDAARGGKLTSAAFATLGLDAKKLANVSTNEALAQVADALAAVENPAKRAGLAMTIFGKSGQGLLPFLMAGSEGIRQAQQEVEQLGLTISRTDAARIEEANDAVTRLAAGVTALAREFAVTLSPAISAAADAARGMGEALRSGGGDRVQDIGRLRTQLAGVTQAADAARRALAAANASTPDAKAKAYATYLDKLREELKIAKQLDAAAGPQQQQIGPDGKAVAQRGDDLRLKDLQHTPKFYADLAAKIAEAEGWTRQLQQTQAGAGQASEATAAQAAATAQVDALKEQERQAKAVADRVADLKQQYDELGMSADQKALTELKAQGATPTQVSQAATYLDQIAQSKAATDAIEAQHKAQEKLADEAKRYYEETRTPAEKYAAELKRIDELLQSGLLNPDTAQRAADAATKAIEAAQPKGADVADGGAPRLAEAIRANSAESQALRFTGGNQIRGAANEVTAKQAVAQTGLQKTMAGHLATLAAASGKADIETVIDF